MSRVLPHQGESGRKRWRKLAPHVFMASLFNKQQCDALLEAIEHQGTSLECNRGNPNNMHDYGIVLKDHDLSQWAATLIERELKCPVSELFGFLPHYDFCEHHAFLTTYGDDGNADLSLHVDSSHITLNICLHNDADGADITFTGSRCMHHLDDTPDHPPTTFRFVRGDALLHLGSQRHFVDAIGSGSRKNLVIWYRLDEEPFDHRNEWIKAQCPACLRAN